MPSCTTTGKYVLLHINTIYWHVKLNRSRCGTRTSRSSDYTCQAHVHLTNTEHQLESTQESANLYQGWLQHAATGYYPANILSDIKSAGILFSLGTDIQAMVWPIGVKFCTMVDLCPRCSFSPFGDDIFRGLQMGGRSKMVLWTICPQRDVVGLCHKLHSLMHGTVAFVCSMRQLTLTCYKLYCTSKCWSHLTIQQGSMANQIFVENRHFHFFIHHLHSTLPLILIVISRLDRGIQVATEMLPLKRGRGVAQSCNWSPTFARYASCWCIC